MNPHDSEDRIFLRGLTTECIIGFIDWERLTPQTIVIDLELPCDCARAARTDSVSDTVDYKRVAKRVLGRVEVSSGRVPGARPCDAAARGVSTRLGTGQHQQAGGHSPFTRRRSQHRTASRQQLTAR
jgi:hypothetical protein